MKKIIFLLLAFVPFLGMSQTFNVAPIADTPPGPFLTFLPTSIGSFVSSAGTRGTSQPYVVSWAQWTISADTVTAPSGYVVSVDNTTFVSSLFFSTSGTTGSRTIYAALAAGNTPGSYSGTIVHTSGPVTGSVPVSGTTAGVPSMSVSPSSLTLTDTAGSPGTPGTLTNTFAYLSGNINVTIPTAIIPLEMSIDGGITWASSQSYSTGSPLPLKVRITSAASAGSTVDTVQFAASGVSTVKIPINSTVSSANVVKIDTLVIPTSSVTASLVSFPITINMTANQFRTTGNGGSVQNANGYDITFSRNAAGTSLYSWEIETYNGSTGQVVMHLLTDSVSIHKNDTIYMRYNQASITTFQGGAAGAVWTGAGNYYSVWHMNQVLTAAGQTETDYTGNGNSLTSVGTWTSGQQVAGPVGFAINSISGNGNYFSFPTIGYSTSFTIETWAKITVADQTSTIFGHNSFANDVNFYGGFFRLYNGSDAVVDGTATPINTWTHLVITESTTAGTTTLTVYHNGTPTATATGAFTYNWSRLFINLTTISSTMAVDEPRISSVARSGPWIAAEYLNQNTPGTFYIYKQGH